MLKRILYVIKILFPIIDGLFTFVIIIFGTIMAIVCLFLGASYAKHKLIDNSSEKITVYHTLEDNHSKRSLLRPATYTIRNDKIIRSVNGALKEYSNCVIADIDNFECTYPDNSGRFGIRDGDYWEIPLYEGVSEISFLEYKITKCNYTFEDTHHGFVKKAITCITSFF